MAQESQRARCVAIGTALEDDDQIAHFGARKFNPIAQQIERCAQRTHNIRDFPLRAVHSIADDDRVVLP